MKLISRLVPNKPFVSDYPKKEVAAAQTSDQNAAPASNKPTNVGVNSMNFCFCLGFVQRSFLCA